MSCQSHASACLQIRIMGTHMRAGGTGPRLLQQGSDSDSDGNGENDSASASDSDNYSDSGRDRDRGSDSGDSGASGDSGDSGDRDVNDAIDDSYDSDDSDGSEMRAVTNDGMQTFALLRALCSQHLSDTSTCSLLM